MEGKALLNHRLKGGLGESKQNIGTISFFPSKSLDCKHSIMVDGGWWMGWERVDESPPS